MLRTHRHNPLLLPRPPQFQCPPQSFSGKLVTTCWKVSCSWYSKWAALIPSVGTCPHKINTTSSLTFAMTWSECGKFNLPEPHLFVIFLEGCQILTCLRKLAFFHTLTDVMMHKGTLRIPWRFIQRRASHPCSWAATTHSPTNNPEEKQEFYNFDKQHGHSAQRAPTFSYIFLAPSCGESPHHSF